MDKVWNGIASAFEAIFPMVEKLHAAPNIFFIIVCGIALIYWVVRQNKYNKEAENNGTLK